jgi:predicted permease
MCQHTRQLCKIQEIASSFLLLPEIVLSLDNRIFNLLMLGTVALNCIVGFDLPVKVAASLKSQKTTSLSKLNISCFDF